MNCYKRRIEIHDLTEYIEWHFYYPHFYSISCHDLVWAERGRQCQNLSILLPANSRGISGRDHILCFNLSIVPGITEFKRKKKEERMKKKKIMPTTKHAKLSAIKHPRRRGQRVSERERKDLRQSPGVHSACARLEFLCTLSLSPRTSLVFYRSTQIFLKNNLQKRRRK